MERLKSGRDSKPFITLTDYRKDEYLSDRQILKKLEKEENNESIKDYMGSITFPYLLH